jgi:radical SAM protein with 4Fe4S-binding SPASM domain
MIGEEFTLDDIAAAVRSGGLLSMEIEFSLRCNFRCQYCYVGQDAGAERELSPDEIRATILQAKALGARKIIVLGGEPMIYPQIMEMLAFIRGEGLAAEMFTNGTGVTAAAARRLYDLGVQVVLKMNSFDERTQNELAGFAGAYDTIQEAFRNLKAAGFPAAGHLMAVSTIICTRNLAEIPAMWQWLREQNITPYFEIITPQGNARDNANLEVEPAALRTVFDTLSEMDRVRFGHTWEPQPPLVGDRCLRHQFSCLVNAYGTVMPCVGVTIPLGNVRERTLAAILRDSEVVQDLRHHKGTIRGPCGACEKAEVCYGCRGAAYQLTGDYLASDPLCWHNVGREQDIMTLPTAAEALIPQRSPMRLVDRLMSVGERVAVVEADVRQDNPFLQGDGVLDGAYHMELIAQAAAAMNGFRTPRPEDGGPQGYLLGARNVRIQGQARVGDTLAVHVFKAAKYGDFGIIEGRVTRGAEVLAEGEIKVWHSAGAGAVTVP